MNDTNRIINGFWKGKPLSPIEVLSIKSYLQNGHEFHLYTYDSLKNVPEGTIIKDAGEIIPYHEMLDIVHNIKKHAYAIFADIFRYQLLYQVGGWWSDVDAICIKHFDIDQDYVFIDEKIKYRDDRICNGIIKAPPGAQIMAACYQKAIELVADIDNLAWYALGPVLLDKMVKEFSLQAYTLPSSQFTPIGNYEVDKWLRPYEIGPEAFSIHIYNDVWSTRHISKHGIYSRHSLLAQLKHKYDAKNDITGLLSELWADFWKKDGFKIIKDKLWFMIQSLK